MLTLPHRSILFIGDLNNQTWVGVRVPNETTWNETLYTCITTNPATKTKVAADANVDIGNYNLLVNVANFLSVTVRPPC